MLPNDARDRCSAQMQVFRDAAHALMVLPPSDNVVLCKTTEHLSYLDLWQPIVVNERIDDPRFFELIGLGGNQIEIEDRSFGCLFIDFKEPSLKGLIPLSVRTARRRLKPSTSTSDPSS